MTGNHPALSLIEWKWDGKRIERAVYRGCQLAVRHLDDMHIGYINGKIVGHADNMPKIAEKLFETVDAVQSYR